MLGDMYGAKFSQAFGAKPGAMWRKVIAELTDDQLEGGMNSLMEAGSAFPPSLPEFRSVCLGSTEAVAGEDEVQALAFELIPSFDRRNLSRIALEAIMRRNMDRARALLSGEAQPDSRERNVLERVQTPGTALVVKQEK